MLIVAHADSHPGSVTLPRAAAVRELPWRLFVHTGQPTPNDIFPDGRGPLIDLTRPLDVPGRSLVCLVASPAEAAATRRAVPRN